MAIFKHTETCEKKKHSCLEELNSEPSTTNPSTGRERDLSLGPPNDKLTVFDKNVLHQ